MRIDSTRLPLMPPTDSSKPAEKSKEDEKLREACKSFEAMLTGMMLKGMRKTVAKSDLFGSASEEDLFQGMMDEEICQSVSKSGSLGIADILYRQLSNDGSAAKQSASDTILRTTAGGPDIAELAVRFRLTDKSEGASK